MIYINFDDLMKNKTVNGKPLNMYRLSKETGIARANLYRLKQGKAKGVEFTTLNTLVKYFDVPINQILKYSSENIYVDLYNYDHFFSNEYLENLYKSKCKRRLKIIIPQAKKDFGDEYVNKNKQRLKKETEISILGGEMNMIRDSLYIQYTVKSKKYWYAKMPVVKDDMNTINPTIWMTTAPTQQYFQRHEYIDRDNIDKLLQKLPYNKRLFLLCKSIKMSGLLKKKSNPKYYYYDFMRDLTHDSIYPDKQEFILKLDKLDKNIKSRDYRMTKKQILNYKQPPKNDFNSNYYNFIIRDHTKE